MPSEIYLVKVGMTMEEGTVEEWYVADGDRVEPGEMLYRLETEKVNLDVDAETAGTVRHLADAGTTCKPGDVVGFIYADDEEIPEVLPTPKPKPDITVANDTLADDKPKQPAAAKPRRAGGRIAASPVARKLAGELGVDLADVTGTGPRGRITKEDVQAVADAAANAPAGPHAGTSTPLTGMRRTIAERMHGSLRDTAQLTMDMEVAMDDAVKLRRDLLVVC
ncbi:MAG: biotin/lipoyl-binding protein [Gammaproteobacteria bacterium]|nr:biotin/lipoyl-binding protein [Gammaproteobacteria bacterium]